MKKFLTVLLFCVLLIVGCAEANIEKVEKKPAKTPIQQTQIPKLPRRIVTFDPVVVNFLADYNIDASIIISKQVYKRSDINPTYVIDKDNITNTDYERIRDFKPEYIFVPDKSIKLTKQLQDYGRIMEIYHDDDYFQNMKQAYLFLSNIFENSKEVSYDIKVSEEAKKLIEDEIRYDKDKLKEFNEYISPNTGKYIHLYSLKEYKEKILTYGQGLKRR